MHQVSANFVPRIWIDDILQRANDEKIFKNVITGDKMWVSGYDIETKEQSSHW
jgi:hypothetical protein